MMKDLWMHILDIAQNSIKAEASLVTIEVEENIRENFLSIMIKDDGYGMTEEMVNNVRNPFTTSRTTRKVGLGIPMLEQTCLQCGGTLGLISEVGKGTTIKATMQFDNIDRPPMGDTINSLYILLITNIDINFKYTHKYNNKEFILDTAEIKDILGGVPLDEPDVMEWLKAYIEEGIQEIKEI